MIATEYYETLQGGVRLFRTYSDSGMMILQADTGIKYADSIDVENSPHYYIELDEPIETAGDN